MTRRYARNYRNPTTPGRIEAWWRDFAAQWWHIGYAYAGRCGVPMTEWI